ncbi:MAG: SpoVA/SpoVAEb family sporulation membrane protein [Clostridia bacterium]|nr:SpoVA/SpoVAEb family sporulation membrane protein [Clostridia bacterium]
MKNSQNFINQNYLTYVHYNSPKTKEKRSLLRAFWVGGVICCIGQGFRYLLEFGLGLKGDELSGFVSMIMIFLGSLLTGLGVYDRIGKYAGGGSIVPITGFANSVVSPAMEFKTEGYIYGLAAKMFVIAGPIIVFGVASSVLVGLIYFVGYLIF